MPNGYVRTPPSEEIIPGAWGTAPTAPRPTAPRPRVTEPMAPGPRPTGPAPITPPSEAMLPPYGGAPTTGGFRWPWETPTGEGFMAPWTAQQQLPGGLFAPLGWQAPGMMAPPVTPPVEPFAPPEQDIWGELGIAPPVQPLTYEEALAKARELGPDYYVDYDEATGGYTVQRKPFTAGTEMSEWQRAQLELAQQEAQRAYEQMMWEREQAGVTPPMTEWQEAQAGYQEAQMAQQQQMQQQMIDWYREQQQAGLGLQQQQMLASLRAQPASWLEYAMLAGEAPVIQPWMLPLMPQQYAGLEAGAPLPGWPEEGESLAGLPELTRPSAQYLARMSPSAREQYAGYRQARTGMAPSDIGWRQWSQAPPTGGFGLQYAR